MVRAFLMPPRHRYSSDNDNQFSISSTHLWISSHLSIDLSSYESVYWSNQSVLCLQENQFWINITNLNINLKQLPKTRRTVGFLFEKIVIAFNQRKSRYFKSDLNVWKTSKNESIHYLILHWRQIWLVLNLCLYLLFQLSYYFVPYSVFNPQKMKKVCVEAYFEPTLTHLLLFFICFMFG